MKDLSFRKCYSLFVALLSILLLSSLFVCYKLVGFSEKIVEKELLEGIFVLQVSVGISLFLGLLIVSFLLYYFKKMLVNPLLEIHQNMLILGKGELPQANVDVLQPVLREINQQLNQVGFRITRIADFLNQISSGNLDAEFVLLSQNDYLGKSILKFVRAWQQEKQDLQDKIKDHKTEIRYCKEQIEKKEEQTQQLIVRKEEQLKEAYEKLIETGTELRQNAEQVLEMNRNLSLAKRELEAKNDELIEINQEKNHLIGVVAHDLRNPLSSSICVIDLLEEESENLTEDQLEYVGAAKQALGRMNNMINQILDIKMIEQKRINLTFDRINLQEILDKVHESFSKIASKKNIQLHLQTSSVFARLDANYTLQIFENLVSNAIKFSPMYKNVYIRLFEQHEQIRIEVQDQGAGISQEDKNKLFGKFQRLSAQPTAGEKSTGLGLSIVKKYVEAMNGQVWCESELGKGATFIVVFDKINELF